jgi:hypothetical protein
MVGYMLGDRGVWSRQKTRGVGQPADHWGVRVPVGCPVVTNHTPGVTNCHSGGTDWVCSVKYTVPLPQPPPATFKQPGNGEGRFFGQIA